MNTALGERTYEFIGILARMLKNHMILYVFWMKDSQTDKLLRLIDNAQWPTGLKQNTNRSIGLKHYQIKKYKKKRKS